MGFLKNIFLTPSYDRYVVLGDSRKGSFWDCANWKTFLFPVLDELLKRAGCTPSVQCRQVKGAHSKEVAFGSLDWSPDDAEKWCHSSENPERDAWKFIDLQVFCPAKAGLIKEGTLPKIYMQVKPMTRSDTESKTSYDEGIHLAFAVNFVRENARHVQATLSYLARLPSVVAIYRTESKITQLNAFESLVREDFMYRGMLESALPDVTKMRSKWDRFNTID